MPLGEGWWLHVDGRYFPVSDHYLDLQGNPRKMGLTKKESLQDRDSALKTAMKKGWIRIRSHHGSTVFEYWLLTHKIADAIWDFSTHILQPGPYGVLNLHEVYSGRGFQVTLKDFYEEADGHLSGVKKAHKELYLIGKAMGQGRRGGGYGIKWGWRGKYRARRP